MVLNMPVGSKGLKVSGFWLMTFPLEVRPCKLLAGVSAVAALKKDRRSPSTRRRLLDLSTALTPSFTATSHKRSAIHINLRARNVIAIRDQVDHCLRDLLRLGEAVQRDFAPDLSLQRGGHLGEH